MTVKKQILLTFFTTAYFLTVFFTGISLVGYWTDVIFSVILVSVSLFVVFKNSSKKTLLSTTLKSLTISSAIVVFGVLGLNLINPFAWDTFKMRSFYQIDIDDRVFNAYFKPVGAYSGGEGTFWITESPKYFFIIEIEKFYDGNVLWDFAAIEWEGELIDQKEMIIRFVQDEVIDKEK